jgi:hypothetical protein
MNQKRGWAALLSLEGYFLDVEFVLGLAALVFLCVAIGIESTQTKTSTRFEVVPVRRSPALVICGSQGYEQPNFSLDLVAANFFLEDKNGAFARVRVNTTPVRVDLVSFPDMLSLPNGTISLSYDVTLISLPGLAPCFHFSSVMLPITAAGSPGNIRFLAVLSQKLPSLELTNGAEDMLVYVSPTTPAQLEESNVKVALLPNQVTLIALEEHQFLPRSGENITSYTSDISAAAYDPSFGNYSEAFRQLTGHPYSIALSFKSNVVTVQEEQLSLSPILLAGALLSLATVLVGLTKKTLFFYLKRIA